MPAIDHKAYALDVPGHIDCIDAAMLGSYLNILTEQAHKPEKFDDDLTKAEAFKRIDELREVVDLD